jgi:hypothetical protein
VRRAVDRLRRHLQAARRDDGRPRLAWSMQSWEYLDILGIHAVLYI